MKPSADLTDVLAKLRERYAASAANTVSAFTQLAEQLQRNPVAPEVVDALRRELHRVHGTAGSYGFHDASRLAAALELVALRWEADPALDRSRRGAIVRQFSVALAAAFDGTSASDADSPLASRLLLVDLDDEVAGPLVAEAVHRGHFVERVTAAALEAMLDANLPRAVIASARAHVTVPEGVPLVLLQGSEGLVSQPGTLVRVLDASSDPREVLHVAESLAAHTGMAGATLMVVDDDPAMLEAIRAIGEGEGMYVQTLASAVDLSAALDEHHPALLLLDVQMPEVDGITATRLLRAERRHAEIPILLVSSAMDAETRAAAFAAGADDLQTKPVVAVELTRRIARLLEIRRHRLVSRGVHPATSLWLPERTLRAFDEALAVATAEGRPMSLALLRPQLPPDGLQRSARWHRECALVAGALSVDGARAGFVDETALAVLFPMGAADAADRLEPFAEAASNETIAWCVGIAEQRRGSDVGARDLLHAAEEGWLSARDAGVRVHRWDEADAGIAPDVIVVEDDQALSDLICHALTARGLSYQVHRNGPEALAGLLALRVHERHPVVLMDVDLPGLDGFSLFERLRVERPGKFQVVFISVHASEGDQLRALRAGALDYLAKPVSLRVLMAKIAVWRAQERPV
jgi:DNA-binding response OmpR family regulator